MAALNKIETFEQFLTTQSSDLSVLSILLAIILASLFGFILSRLYIKYGRSLSNREKFGSNFILLSTTTAFIIIIVKSSLALSLGLVGALSIVRFRAAIKEPEELSFLFICIAIGLGFGAYQWIPTIISFIVIMMVIFARHKRNVKKENQDLYITVSGKVSGKVSLRSIKNILVKHCSAVHLKRFDKIADSLEADFLVGFESFNNLDKARNELESLSKSINVSYIDRA